MSLQFRSSVERLKALLRMHERITTSNGVTWRQDYVRTRRAFMEVLGEMRHALRSLEGGEGIAPIQKHYRLMTTALALHQADWPVVAIDLKDPGYMKSNENAKHSVQAFFREVDNYFLSIPRKAA